MEFVCLKENLEKAINIVQKAVSSRSTLQILEGILIECGERLKLTGNDLEIGIECYADAQIIEKGSIVINARLFGDIIKKMPGTEVKIKTGDNYIAYIESEFSHFEINGMDPSGYPAMPVIKKENAFNMKQGVFRDLIRQTIFAVSIDETRPVLTGSLLECKDGTATMVSCDSFRVAVRKAEIEDENLELKIIIPGRILGEVSKILQNEDEDMNIFCTRNQVQFDMGEYKLVSRLLEGEYFKYESFIPNNFETKVVINRQRFLESVERASVVIVTEEKRYPVTFRIEGDNMIIQTTTNIGSARDMLTVEAEGNDIEIRFNPRYFIESLRAIDDEVVEVCFTNDIGPCIIKPIDSNDYIYLIVPLRK